MGRANRTLCLPSGGNHTLGARKIAGRILLSCAFLVVATLSCQFPAPAAPTPTIAAIPGTLALTNDFAYYSSPAWSPDGSSIAALRGGTSLGPDNPFSEVDVVLFELDPGDHGRAIAIPTVAPGSAYAPVMWQPGAEAISFYHFGFFGGKEGPYLLTYHPESGEMSTTDFCRCTPVAFNENGTELLVVDSPEGSFHLSWFNLASGETRSELSLVRKDAQEHQYFGFALSPDKSILLLDDLDGNISKYEIGSGQPPVPFISLAASPAWSPDGSKLVYAQLPSTSTLDSYLGQLVIANADGSSPETLFPAVQPAGMLSPAWSPDGTQIAFLYGSSRSNALLIANLPERLRP